MSKDICKIESACVPAGGGWLAIRVRREVYNEIRAICEETGKSNATVGDELLRFALDRVEVIHPGEP